MNSKTLYLLAVFVLVFAFVSPIANGGSVPSLITRSDLSIDWDFPRSANGAALSIPLEPRTNTERLKRGLGSALPKRRHNLVSFDAGGRYGFTTGLENAIHVSTCSNSNPRSLTTLNGNVNYPDLGLVISSNNANDPGGPLPPASIGLGSFHYLFVDATIHTEPLATSASQGSSLGTSLQKSLATESSIWNLANTGELTPAWVNDDGTVQEQQLYFYTIASVFLVVGDYASFVSQFPASANVRPVIWVFIPDSD